MTDPGSFATVMCFGPLPIFHFNQRLMPHDSGKRHDTSEKMLTRASAVITRSFAPR